MGGLDIGMPSEGGSSAPEQLSEQAKQQFAAAAAGLKALQREEKKSKKRDDRVAKTIMKFLSDEEHTRFFVLISRLVARDCPSVFILALLSLIDEESKTVVDEFAQEHALGIPQPEEASFPVLTTAAVDARGQQELVLWVTRMQLVLTVQAREVLSRLLVDEGNLDGTVLQLTTFTLQDFFLATHSGKSPPFETLHPVAGAILQTVFEPFMDEYEPPKTSTSNEED